jgi:Spy/CpxP family protein refolding chaperone
MKTNMLSKGFLAIAITLALIISSGSVHAQRGMGQRMQAPEDNPRMEMGMRDQFIPDLTPEQDAKIKELRIKHLKEITPLRNEMNEKKARLQTLRSVDKPDMNAINKTIDEIALIKANLMKKREAHRVEISSLLTDEQRVILNSREGRHGKRMGNNRENRPGRMGDCPFRN